MIQVMMDSLTIRNLYGHNKRRQRKSMKNAKKKKINKQKNGTCKIWKMESHFEIVLFFFFFSLKFLLKKTENPQLSFHFRNLKVFCSDQNKLNNFSKTKINLFKILKKQKKNQA